MNYIMNIQKLSKKLLMNLLISLLFFNCTTLRQLCYATENISPYLHKIRVSTQVAPNDTELLEILPTLQFRIKLNDDPIFGGKASLQSEGGRHSIVDYLAISRIPPSIKKLYFYIIS